MIPITDATSEIEDLAARELEAGGRRLGGSLPPQCRCRQEHHIMSRRRHFTFCGAFSDCLGRGTLQRLLRGVSSRCFFDDWSPAWIPRLPAVVKERWQGLLWLESKTLWAFEILGVW